MCKAQRLLPFWSGKLSGWREVCFRFVPHDIHWSLGLSQVNMDYSLCNALANSNIGDICILIILYDIICQYHCNLPRRLRDSPKSLLFPAQKKVYFSWCHRWGEMWQSLGNSESGFPKCSGCIPCSQDGAPRWPHARFKLEEDARHQCHLLPLGFLLSSTDVVFSPFNSQEVRESPQGFQRKWVISRRLGRDIAPGFDFYMGGRYAGSTQRETFRCQGHGCLQYNIKKR